MLVHWKQSDLHFVGLAVLRSYIVVAWEVGQVGAQPRQKNLFILHFDFPFKRKWSFLVMFASFSLFSSLYLEHVNTKSWVSEVVPPLYLNWSSLLWLCSSCTCKTTVAIHHLGLDRHWVRDMELSDRTDLPKDTLIKIEFHLNWVTFTRKWLSAKHKALGRTSTRVDSYSQTPPSAAEMFKDLWWKKCSDH